MHPTRSSRVQRCNLRGEYASTGAVVIKTSGKRPKIGGVANVLPVGTVASVNAVFEGLCHGMFVTVMQDVRDGVSFSTAYSQQGVKALDSLAGLMEHLATVACTERNIPLSELVAPFSAWDEVAEILQEKDIVPPSGGTRITTKLGVRHGDLHLENILVTPTSAVLIDCDEPVQGGLAVDVVSLLVSTLTHPGSPIRSDKWPTGAEIHESFGYANFGATHPWADFFSLCEKFRNSLRGSEREFWGLTLAFTARQYQYSDVLRDTAVVERLDVLLATACRHLRID
jgi:hypothetical protein